LTIRQVKFVLPFKLDVNDPVPSLVEAAPNITMIRNYAQEKGIKVLTDENLEYNPYLPQDFDFFDVAKAELKIDFEKYKVRPKFSIIIPTFNKKDSLKFVLNNFFKQNYPKSQYEIIIVDDGSNDKTLQVIKKIRPTCNFKYFYWPRKKIKVKEEFKKFAKFYNRVGPARNIGIKHAQGKIVLFNDADILVTKNCLKKHQVYHQRYSNIIVRGFRMFLPEKFNPNFEKIENFSYLDKISSQEKPDDEMKLHCRMYNLSKKGWQRVVTSNLSIRKKYLEKVNGFSRDFVFWGFEDVDLGYRLSKKLNLKFVWDDKIKVYHLHHSKESGGELNDLLIFWFNTNILYRKYLDEEIYKIFRDAILYRLDKILLE